MADKKLSEAPDIISSELALGDKILVRDISDIGEAATGKWKEIDISEFGKTVGAEGTNLPVQQIYLDVDFTLDEYDELYAKLNARPQSVVRAGGYFMLLTVRRVWIDSAIQEITTSRYFVRGQFAVQADGNAYYGVNHPVANDSIRFYQKEKVVTRVTPSIVIGGKLVDLGDVGTTDIHTAFISADPDITGQTIVVRATQGGILKDWVYVGDEDSTPVLSDFILMPTSQAQSAPVPQDQGIKMIGDNNVPVFSPFAQRFIGATVTEDIATGYAIVTITGGGGGTTSYVGLTDTPTNRTGEAGNFIIVNPGEDGEIYSNIMPNPLGVISDPTGILHVGNTVSTRSSDPVINMRHEINDANGSGNAHGISDSNIINRSGDMAYASFDSRFLVQSGAEIHDHFASFQDAPTFDTSGLIDDLYGVFSLPTINTGSSVDQRFSMYIADHAGVGTVQQHYGLWVNNLTKAVENWAIKTNGGLVELGSTGSGDKEEVLISRNTAALGDVQFIRWKAGSGFGGAIGDNFVLSNRHDLGIYGSSSNTKNLGLTVKYDGQVYIGDTPPTTSPSEKLTVDGKIQAVDVNFSGLPVFADDASASSLSAGDMYQTATGELRIKL